MSCDDEEHLAKIIVESLREVEKYFEEDGALVAEAFRALDRAELAVLELGDRLWRLRGELDAIVAPLSEIP